MLDIQEHLWQISGILTGIVGKSSQMGNALKYAKLQIENSLYKCFQAVPGHILSVGGNMAILLQ